MKYELGIMENGNRKINTFQDLDAWKEGHKLALMVYSITKSFPSDEKFGLTSQIKRAAVSVTSNIAEGFSRNSYKEKLQFYSMALGSLTETQNQLILARDVNYLSLNEFAVAVEQAVKAHKITNGLIKRSRSLILNHNS